MKNKYGELAKNTIIFACASFGAKLIMFFLLPLYTNVLSTSEYGIVELIITTIDLLTPVLTLSITDAILRFGLDKDIPHEKVLKDSFVFLAGVSVIVIILTPLFGLYRPLKGYEWLVTITMIVFMFRSMFTFYLKSIDKNLFFAIDTIVYTLLLAGLNILFLVGLKMGVYGYMLSLILASFLSIVFCVIVGHATRPLFKCVFDKQLLKRMLIYSTPLILNALSWWITHSSDKYMLEYFWSSSEVGIYSAAAKIPALLSVFSSFFTQAWTLSSVKEYDSDRDKSFYSNIFKLFAATLFIAAASIIFITKPFMSVYVGESFESAWKYVPILLVAALFNCFSSFFGSMYVATRRNIGCSISTLVCAITNIILNFILIPRYSIFGAAIATAIAYIVVAVYRMLDCQRTFKFDIQYRKHAFSSVLVILSAGFMIFSNYRFIVSGIVIVLLVIIYRKDIFNLLKSVQEYFKKGNKTKC